MSSDIFTIQNPHTHLASPALGRDAAAAELSFGTVYTGVVVATDPGKKSYKVQLDRLNATVPDCLYAGGQLTSFLFGIRMNFTLPPGTRVTLLYGNPSFIIGTAPADRPDNVSGTSRTLTQTGVTDDADTLKATNSNYNSTTAGADFFVGELEIGNLLGPAIQFLTTLIKVQGSERAKVECHLVDDLVRIVSGTYRHFSAFGDYEIVNGGGGPTVRQKGCSKTHEAWGQVNAQDPKASINAKTVNPESVADKARHRYESFLGYLGDFIHLIVSDPEEVVGQLGNVQDGKFDAHVNNDGSLVVRSVADISFERVVCIPVPIENLEVDDPNGNTRAEIEAALESGGLELDNLLQRWDYGKQCDAIHLLPYQLRHYARYLSQCHAYARILSQDKDFYVPTEAESFSEEGGGDAEGPRPSWNNKEKDVARANQGAPEYFPVYSCRRLLRDGSLLDLDGYGNCILTGKQGIQISSYRNIEFEAAGDVRFAVGHNLLMNVRRNFELNAITGGIIMRARAWFRLLCEWGSIFIKSDAPDPQAPDFSTLVDSHQKTSEEDPTPEILEKAVLIQASLGQMAVIGGRKIIVECDGAGLTEAEQADSSGSAGSVGVQSLYHQVSLNARQDLLIAARQGFVGLQAGAGIIAAAGEDGILMRAQGPIDFNQQLTIRTDAVSVRRLKGDLATLRYGIWGPEVPPMPPTDDEGNAAPGAKMPPSHFNHIRTKEDGTDDPEFLTTDERVAMDALLTRGMRRIQTFRDTPPSWNYLPPSEYVFAYEDSEEQIPWRSLSQERLIDTDENDPLISTDQYADWNWSTDNRLVSPASTTGDKYPYPWYGQNTVWQYFDNDEPLLHVPTTTPAASLNQTPTRAQATRVMKAKKHQ